MSDHPGMDAWGIYDGFYDIIGQFHPTSPETRARLRRAMMAKTNSASEATGPDRGILSVWVVPFGAVVHFPEPGVVQLENGAADTAGRREIPVGGEHDADLCGLPIGYHDYYYGNPDGDDGENPDGENPEEPTTRVRVIVVPEHCPTPPRCWGISLQLYACRSARSWGIGDLRDLRRVLRWAKSVGADVAMINPLSAVAPTNPQNPSPYYGSSRRFRNPLYICVEETPGRDDLSESHREEIAQLGEAARQLNSVREIDRDAVFKAKDRALRILCDTFLAATESGTATKPEEHHTRTRRRFEAFCAEWGESLDEFAVWNVLARRYGAKWCEWPEAYRHPASDAVRRFRESPENASSLQYEKWLQWVADEQFAVAASELPVIPDLPVGVSPDGVDAWAWQDFMAFDCEAGAPPDAFNPLGQRWGLPPMIPYRLRRADYRPFIETVRASLRHAAGLRIDHVMGCFRLFWFPTGEEASEGTYVQYPHHDLLGIVRLEASRRLIGDRDDTSDACDDAVVGLTATPLIVGEDLGTVEPFVRETLRRSGMMRFLLQLFDGQPSEFPEMAMAMVTTHDLPTLAGLWSGSDEAAMLRAISGLKPGIHDESRRRISELTGIPEPTAKSADGSEPASIGEVIESAYRVLGESPSRIVLVTMEDLLAVEERPNMPGTIDAWPNWRLAIPGGIERLETDPLPRRIADILGTTRKK